MVHADLFTLAAFGLLICSVNSFQPRCNPLRSDLSRAVSISNNNPLAKSPFYKVTAPAPIKVLSLVEDRLIISDDRLDEPTLLNPSLSVVYNSSDIASYFMRNPALVVSRVFQIASEVATIMMAGMDGMIHESIDYETRLIPTLRKSRVKLAAAVRDSMIRMGPTFIKLGQALSSRQDLIGLEGISQLQLLQDAIPSTFTTEEAREIIRQDLLSGNLDSESKAMVEQLLSTLSVLPVAAASLGQVYRARINGMDVAVKVQRPHLREQVAADFLLARWGATFLTETGLLRSDGVGAVDEYASRLFEELDYINEANNLKKFAALYSENGSASDTLPSPGDRKSVV